MAGAGNDDPTLTDLCGADARHRDWECRLLGTATLPGRRLVPRYLCDPIPDEAPAHVGSRDVDLAVVLLVDDPTSKSYETLARNLTDAGFVQAPLDEDPDFRWRKDAGGHS